MSVNCDVVSVLGISCNVDEGEVRVVVLRVTEEKGRLPAHTVLMDHRTDPGEDHAKKLSSVEADLETVVKKNSDAQFAVVRAMDYSPLKKGITNEDEARLEAQGVVLATVRRHLDRVVAMNGNEIGKACGSDKPTVLARAGELFGDKHKDAGIAALAALALATS